MSSEAAATQTAEETRKEPLSIGFLGAGMMASAIMDGLLNSGVVESPSQIWCADKYPPTVEKKQQAGFHASSSNQDVITNTRDAIILAVKPHIIPLVCQDLRDTPSPHDPLIISIAAGISLETLQPLLPSRRIVRVMPNTPCLVGQGAAGYALGQHATLPSDQSLVDIIFGSVGVCTELSEVLLNAVTGLSGSGPAYVFQFIEALSDGGVRAGLPRHAATQLAAQTVKGAAEMVLKTGKHPGLLKDGVTSPGGTTIAGVEALEQGGFRAATIGAVTAATRRSMQLGGIPEEDIRHKYNL